MEWPLAWRLGNGAEDDRSGLAYVGKVWVYTVQLSESKQAGLRRGGPAAMSWD